MMKEIGSQNSRYEIGRMKDERRFFYLSFFVHRPSSIVYRTLILFSAICFLSSISYAQYESHQMQTEAKQEAAEKKQASKNAAYYCPMHPSYTFDSPGDCPICNMKLVKKTASQAGSSRYAGEAGREDASYEGKAAASANAGNVLYYRNPMNPEITSPVPMKDSMGMDYVPVYAVPAGRQEQESGVELGVYISSERQQFIGMKQEKAMKRKLVSQIITVGKVAYDPALYVAQEEYLQALKTQNALRSSSIVEQSKSLVEAAERKLLLLGMSKEQIAELTKQNKPQSSLYLPENENTVWVYMAIYEYEIGLVKKGMPVEIEAVAFPGEAFTGKISGITPVLDPMTRSIQARAEVSNLDNKLKPEMFVNVKINVDLGEKLAVSEEAILNTGKKTLVVVVKENGHFLSKEVKLGQRAQGFYEILEGLNEGDIVVTSGNFLIDSESRLQSAISGE